MLGHHRHDVVAAVAAGVRRALDRQIVRFGRAAREDDLARRRADERGDFAARANNGLVRVPAVGVLAAGGIAEVFGEVRQHRLEHAGVDRRGGVIVEVDGLRHCGTRLVGDCELCIGRYGRLPPGNQSFRVNAIGAETPAKGISGTSDEISCSEHVSSAEMMRSRMRQSGSRTLHFGVLVAVLRLGRAGGDRQRSVNRLDDVGGRDDGGGPRQAVAAARALMRGHESAAGEALQHLGHQLDRDVVLLGDLAGAGRGRVRANRQVLHRDERVVGFLG